MEMHEIQYFLAVCDTLNFNRAAERCHVSQPALTRAVQKLEDELGGLLFQRDRRGTRLTELGDLMRRQLSEVRHQTETARAAARRFVTLRRATVTLGLTGTIVPPHFIRFLNDFRHQQPDAQVTLVEGMPNRLSEVLLEGALDAALMPTPRTSDSRLRHVTIYRERFVVAFPPEHRFVAWARVHVRDLRDEIYVSRVNGDYHDHVADLCRRHGVDIQSAYRTERQDWIHEMIAAGMGVTIMPEHSAMYPGVVTRPIDPGLTRDIALVTLARESVSPAAATLIRSIAGHSWSRETVPDATVAR